MLDNLKAILEKGSAHAAARKFDESVLVNGRLAPNMLPLSSQVQIAADFARGTTSRLAGEEPPKIEDTEKTIAELIARVDTSIAYVKRFTESQLEGSENRQITRTIRGNTMTFSGLDYLVRFALPNFYFHLTAAYAILRHNGVEIGKADYLGLQR
jgi:hypothetical protein